MSEKYLVRLFQLQGKTDESSLEAEKNVSYILHLYMYFCGSLFYLEIVLILKLFCMKILLFLNLTLSYITFAPSFVKAQVKLMDVLYHIKVIFYGEPSTQTPGRPCVLSFTFFNLHRSVFSLRETRLCCFHMRGHILCIFKLLNPLQGLLHSNGKLLTAFSNSMELLEFEVKFALRTYVY